MKKIRLNLLNLTDEEIKAMGSATNKDDDWCVVGRYLYRKENAPREPKVTPESALKRIENKLKAYYKANVGPVTVPRNAKRKNQPRYFRQDQIYTDPTIAHMREHNTSAFASKVDYVESVIEGGVRGGEHNFEELYAVDLHSLQGSLNPIETEVLKQHLLMGYSTEETAQQLNMSVQAVNRCIRKIKDIGEKLGHTRSTTKHKAPRSRKGKRVLRFEGKPPYAALYTYYDGKSINADTYEEVCMFTKMRNPEDWYTRMLLTAQFNGEEWLQAKKNNGKGSDIMAVCGVKESRPSARLTAKLPAPRDVCPNQGPKRSKRPSVADIQYMHRLRANPQAALDSVRRAA